MTDLPQIALSVRQPWAWAIIYAGKTIENRGPVMLRHLPKPICRRIAIHASKGMTRDEYEVASDFINGLAGRIVCPSAADLLRGGIVGSVDVVDIVTKSLSPWFFGPRGMVLRDPKPCEFVPAVGALGYFKWTRGDTSIVPKTARWMTAPVAAVPAIGTKEPASLPLFDAGDE